MKKRAPYIIGAIVLVAIAGYAMANFRTNLVAYVPYEVARARAATVQVAGGLAEGSSRYDSDAQALLFTLTDPESGDTMPVRYHGLKPANFEEAVSIVAIGRWNANDGEFAADKLLVKCPSKYQGAEVEEKQYS
jgi:cytochrome c-type biogenesis protein CcmE